MKTWHTSDLQWIDDEWDLACMRTYGHILTGAKRHFCHAWDDLPIDETCDEFDGCTCWGTRRENT